ncbi:TIGR03757 family integrating conjugative element protein [Xylella fastidiosa]|uniref:TIGR03757 family integrating conjugative element protein n=1 Tax=Xylella fastidiosa TaxID=2371 RepID=A0ABC8AE64_XYLFS|nr:TIGR03757 family integrating conjugative element protein [Xylella fastidiosa]ALR06574.1 TIGR03757 family integrating conjugative element protein [Xylella fastidiosa]
MRRFPSFPATRRPWLKAAGLAALFAAGALHAETWVITDQAHPVAGRADRLILLDAPARIEAELASGLPADPARAENLARDRLSKGGADLQRRIAIAYQGVTDAWSLGITSVPAVVVDQRYVVYGEPDVARAVARIEQHRGAQP